MVEFVFVKCFCPEGHVQYKPVERNDRMHLEFTQPKHQRCVKKVVELHMKKLLVNLILDDRL